MKRLKILLKDLYQIWRIADKRTFFTYLVNIARCVPEILRTKTLQSANERMKGTICRFALPGHNTVMLDGKFFGIAKELYCRGIYFTIPGFQINSSDCVVDLGAQVGTFTTLAAVCGRKVISVEAQSGFLPLIESNLRHNNCFEKVNLEWGLVGAESGLFSNPITRREASHYLKEPPILSLADLFAKYRLDQVDFLKVDIEGSEFSLFSGDLSWLKVVRRIALEVHFEFGDAAALARVLESAGFEVWLVNNDQRVVEAFDQGNGTGSGYIFAKRKTVGSASNLCAEFAA